MLGIGVLPGPKPSLRGGGPPGLRPVPHRAGALGPVSTPFPRVEGISC